MEGEGGDVTKPKSEPAIVVYSGGPLHGLIEKQSSWGGNGCVKQMPNEGVTYRYDSASEKLIGGYRVLLATFTREKPLVFGKRRKK